MSGDNFTKIFYDENRKGFPLDYKFCEELKPIHKLSQKISKYNKCKDCDNKKIAVQDKNKLVKKIFKILDKKLQKDL